MQQESFFREKFSKSPDSAYLFLAIGFIVFGISSSCPWWGPKWAGEGSTLEFLVPCLVGCALGLIVLIIGYEGWKASRYVYYVTNDDLIVVKKAGATIKVARQDITGVDVVRDGRSVRIEIISHGRDPIVAAKFPNYDRFVELLRRGTAQEGDPILAD